MARRVISSFWMVALFALTPADAAEVRISGFAAADVRYFPESPQFPGQYSGAEASLILNPEFRLKTDDGRHRFSLIPFLRLAGRDDERTHWDLREAYWLYLGREWELLVGLNKVFWGVTESRHLVDIINQTDLVEDTDEEDKLGQPMINLATQQDWGRLDLFVLPGFRERTFPGRRGRLRTAVPVDENAAEFESDAEELHVDVALRYSHAVGDWDVGAYAFHGTSREPRLVPSGAGRLIPHYDIVTQVGTDVQLTHDAWLLKFEGILREGQGNPFFATVAGFEYTFFKAFETDWDVGLLAEYLYDGRDQDRAPGTAADDDIFMGARVVLNDVQNTEALFGAVVDREEGSAFVSVEFGRRVGSSWKVEIEARGLVGVGDDNALTSFRRDSFVNVRLSRFF